MDWLDPKTWTQQFEAFKSAPIILLPTLGAIGIAVWWFRGTVCKTKIDALEGRITIFEDRLKLAAERLEASDKAKADVDLEFRRYKEAVAANAGRDALIASEARVETAIEHVSSANNAVRAVLTALDIQTKPPALGTPTLNVVESAKKTRSVNGD